MKNCTNKLMVIVVLAGLSLPAHSTEMVIIGGDEKRMPLAEPREICISPIQTIGDVDNMTLLYHLVVPPQDHGKRGVVFVGARLKSQPDVTWLTGGNNHWYDARGNEEYSWPISYGNPGELEPVIPITVFGKPVNLASYTEEGEIWVGYGLWPENGPDNSDELLVDGNYFREVYAWLQRTAYEEMLSSERFQKIWTTGELHSPYRGICLITTEIVEREPWGAKTSVTGVAE